MGRYEQGVVLEGLAGVVEDGECGEGLRAEPVGEERLDQGGGGGVGGERVVVAGDGGEEVGIGGVPMSVAAWPVMKRLGVRKPMGCGLEDGGGDAGGFGGGDVGVVADGERAARAGRRRRRRRAARRRTRRRGGGGWWRWTRGAWCGRRPGRAWRRRRGRPAARRRDTRGRCRSRAGRCLRRGRRIVGGDGVPVLGEGLVGGRADAVEALGGGRDGAGVERGEGEGGAGGEWLREGDDGFRIWPVWSASVSTRWVAKGRRVTADGGSAGGEGVPVGGGGDVEDEAGERGGAVVAHGEDGADGDSGGGGSEVDVEVVGGEGEGGALGVGDGEGVGLGGGAAAAAGWVSGGGGGVAGEEDFAWRRCGWSGRIRRRVRVAGQAGVHDTAAGLTMLSAWQKVGRWRAADASGLRCALALGSGWRRSTEGSRAEAFARFGGSGGFGRRRGCGAGAWLRT